MSARWIICPTCQGDGSSSRHLGVVNPDDFSPDEWDSYRSGGYDQTCSNCEGTGKVREDQGLQRHERTLRYERLGDFHAHELQP